MTPLARRAGVGAAITAGVVAAAGCGGASSSQRAAATPTPSPAGSTSTAPTGSVAPGGGSLDPCLVGTWAAETTTVMLAFEGGVTLTGGAGEVLTVEPSGRFSDDSSATASPQVDTPSGHQYRVETRGVTAGSLTSSAGRITVMIDDPAQVSVDVVVDGIVAASTHPPATAPEIYVCGADGMLTISSTDGSTTTRYRRR